MAVGKNKTKYTKRKIKREKNYRNPRVSLRFSKSHT